MKTIAYSIFCLFLIYLTTSCSSDTEGVLTEENPFSERKIRIEEFYSDAFSDSILHRNYLRSGPQDVIEAKPTGKKLFPNLKIYINKNPQSGWSPFPYNSPYPWITDVTQHSYVIYLPSIYASVRPIVDPVTSGWSGANPNDQRPYVWVEYDNMNNTAILNTRTYNVKSDWSGRGPWGIYPINEDQVIFKYILND